MFQIFIFFILSLVSGYVKHNPGMQHVPVCTLGSETEVFDFPFRSWQENSLLRLETEVAKFEYDMLGHPVIETKLDSAYTYKLIFDTGCAGMLILDKNFAEKSGLIHRFVPTKSLKSGWNFKRDIPCMIIRRPVSISIGSNLVCYSEYHVVDGRTLNFF